MDVASEALLLCAEQQTPLKTVHTVRALSVNSSVALCVSASFHLFLLSHSYLLRTSKNSGTYNC